MSVKLWTTNKIWNTQMVYADYFGSVPREILCSFICWLLCKPTNFIHGDGLYKYVRVSVD